MNVLPSPGEPGAKDALMRDAVVYLTCLHETGHALGLPDITSDGNAAYIAADMLAQAEHDADASAILLTTSTELAAPGVVPAP